jgi:hypothetical protein
MNRIGRWGIAGMDVDYGQYPELPARGHLVETLALQMLFMFLIK